MKRQQQGLSLIELMIAILISSLLLLGVIQLFGNTSTSDRTNTAMARIQESGRIALEIIGADARRAGYQGCSSAANKTTIGSLTFPADALAATENSVTFRYATAANTGTLFGANKTCDDDALYLNNVTYSSCPSGGVQHICKSVNGGTATAVLDNAEITSISFGVPSGGVTQWKDSEDISSTDLALAHAVRLTLTVTDSRNEVSREFSSTYELRNRL
ncbi:hypothetical protein D3C76_764050 [compost metagenome]|uniref:Type IV pilus assembly protein PilW n=1 Tax=Pseudomonas jinjuensis TaxID=198616 RepID=A0A1H0ML79_9PSED|nr:prepilin-type N-terminal cleavage/methylation domain-containing protein [Pseudomonas jinjuensis]SDO81094.1 type IV pilus assembly protein PilW [Pseudomonas jinjuensis]